MMSVLEAKLHHFLESIPISNFSTQGSLSQECQAATSNLLTIYANEAVTALRLIENSLSRNDRILEIGAGLCLLSFFLKKEGFDIVALEPGIAGFDFFTHFKNELIGHFKEVDLRILPCRADELKESQVGRFDLIFSQNVLEHIPNLDQTLQAMLWVLERNGRMVHSCPNYLIPYEPHFRIPVLKVAPGLSEFLFRKRITKCKSLWDSLNFITYLDVRKFARDRKLQVSLTKGLFHAALARLGNDTQFRLRQGSFLFMLLYSSLKASGLLAMTRHLPPALATPMVFTITRA